jgi:hypothetical protein
MIIHWILTKEFNNRLNDIFMLVVDNEMPHPFLITSWEEMTQALNYDFINDL